MVLEQNISQSCETACTGRVNALMAALYKRKDDAVATVCFGTV